MSKNIEIWDFLREADNRNLMFYDTLTSEEKKNFVPYVFMRWMSSVNDNSGLSEYYILMINELVNVGFWELTKHPELQWKLLALSGSGSATKHQWIPNHKKYNTNKLDSLLLEHYPSANNLELTILKEKLTKNTLKEFMLDLGMTDQEIKPILDDFKKLNDK